jgi:Fic family protein
MDLTPAFFDRWREHRELDYLDRVREIFEQAAFDAPWLEEAQLRALAREAHATLRLSDIRVDDEVVKAIVDRGESGSAGVPEATAAAVRAYGDAHRAAMAAAAEQAVVTPALLDDLHARLLGGDGPQAGKIPTTDAALAALCDWLASPPDALHPVVTAAVAQVELLRMRRWVDGNARLARLALMLLLTREGYGYRGLLSPSTHWSDPRRLPERPAEELPPEQAETHPAVEHVVDCVARALRETVSWARTEEGSGSLQAMLFSFPLQP